MPQGEFRASRASHRTKARPAPPCRSAAIQPRWSSSTFLPLLVSLYSFVLGGVEGRRWRSPVRTHVLYRQHRKVSRRAFDGPVFRLPTTWYGGILPSWPGWAFYDRGGLATAW